MSRKLTLADYFKPENAGAAAAAAVPGPVSSDFDSDDGDVGAAGAAAVDYDEYAGRSNQLHPENLREKFWETSRGNQTGENLSGKGILKQTSKARRESKKFLKQQQLEEQRRQQILQQQQLEEQQRQLLAQQQKEEERRQRREDQIEANVYNAMNPVRLSDQVHGNPLHPQNRARDDLKKFMNMSKDNQGGGRRYTKKKSKKSKSKKSKSKRNKVQKKKTRRSRYH